jgi:hypothetical protein
MCSYERVSELLSTHRITVRARATSPSMSRQSGAVCGPSLWVSTRRLDFWWRVHPSCPGRHHRRWTGALGSGGRHPSRRSLYVVHDAGPVSKLADAQDVGLRCQPSGAARSLGDRALSLSPAATGLVDETLPELVRTWVTRVNLNTGVPAVCASAGAPRGVESPSGSFETPVAVSAPTAAATRPGRVHRPGRRSAAAAGPQRHRTEDAACRRAARRRPPTCGADLPAAARTWRRAMTAGQIWRRPDRLRWVEIQADAMEPSGCRLMVPLVDLDNAPDAPPLVVTLGEVRARVHLLTSAPQDDLGEPVAELVTEEWCCCRTQ